MTPAVLAIGLTGGIGSGKTTVANMFGQLGADLIDTDQIAHQLTGPAGAAMEAIRHEFGAQFVDSNGAMDRAKMRALVFSHQDEKKRLESILHPLIRRETDTAAKQATGAYSIFIVPLLVESGSWKTRVDRVLLIDCQESTQMQRVINRNGLPKEQVSAIMRAQASREQRQQAADDVILNEGDLSAIHAQVSLLHAKYLALAEAKKTI
ncbi:dephospho-CoA kinase [soil metagenome]